MPSKGSASMPAESGTSRAVPQLRQVIYVRRRAGPDADGVVAGHGEGEHTVMLDEEETT
jgi:ethanolamine utilization protein EutA (predicted chaperonin)